ncbi:MAG: toll/interleukin-1 receptor domain-containing protein [Anaerolineae bacterium]|jgi:hypothetical protein|nr:toll/interleukin-1 receptor domain-containing protein [Anaerolineae bacterium]
MLNIACASRDLPIAEEMKSDLVASSLTLDHDYLLVLVTAAALQDASVTTAVQEAAPPRRVLPVLLEKVPLPPALAGRPLLDFSRSGYRKERLVYFLRREDIGKERLAGNRRILGFMLVIVVIMFIAAWLGIAGGLVAFPVDEYATENAMQNAMIDAFVLPTLDAFMPRTTQDATDFPQTLAAASTRIQVFLAQTATAIPANARATLEGIATAADLTMTAAALPTAAPVATGTPGG